MSDPVKHECGIAVIRLLKPLSYYREKYGTALYGLNKLYLLMEKQHNRGQDGAGVGPIKLNAHQGQRFMSRYRSNSPQAIAEIFQKIHQNIDKLTRMNPALIEDTEWMRKNVSFVAEMMLGHLRYGTYGRNEIDSCHPFINNHHSSTRSLIMAGNFNLTNIEDLGWKKDGSRPDTAVVLDRITWHLENELNRVATELQEDQVSKENFRNRLRNGIDFKQVLTNAVKEFDGGYVLAGLSGAGYAFALRDPSGIRPAYYYKSDEIMVVASERPAIQTTFNLNVDDIHELKPGHAIIADRQGNVGEYQCAEPKKKMSCSFERIYFSRGSDKDIYQERKKLGHLLATPVSDIDGTYTLDYLEKQQYYLKFTPPTGYSATVARATSDDKDSDVDHSFGPNTTRAFDMQPASINENIDMGLAFGELPVDWLSLNAKRINKTHEISWSTAREVNVSYYVVERRMETDKDFAVIPGKVSAKGNTSQVSSYQLTDLMWRNLASMSTE